MISTSKNPCPASANILLYGRDFVLLQTRQWLLNQANYNVTTAATLEAAAYFLGSGPVDVCILCHTLSSEERNAMRAKALELWPCVQILQLSTAIGHTTRAAGQMILSTGDGPVALLNGVREAIDNRASGNC